MIIKLTQRTSVNPELITKIYVSDYYSQYPQHGRAPFSVTIYLNVISKITVDGKNHDYTYDQLTIECNSREDVDDLLSKLSAPVETEVKTLEPAAE